MIHGRVGISPGRQQQANDFNAITGRSEVQRGITLVGPVKDLGLVQLGFINTSHCEVTIRLEQVLNRMALRVGA